MKESENNAVVTDMELENNEHPIGRVCHLSTVTHAFRGKLRAVTASYYILEKGSHMIGVTGNIEEFSKSPKFKAEEQGLVATETWIPRGAVAWILPF
jgi:hypothetical protein